MTTPHDNAYGLIVISDQGTRTHYYSDDLGFLVRLAREYGQWAIYRKPLFFGLRAVQMAASR